MDAQECAGVELLFEVGHRLAQQMCLVLGADADVVFFGADPADLRYRQEENAAL